jgi:hypothetical protein
MTIFQQVAGEVTCEAALDLVCPEVTLAAVKPSAGFHFTVALGNCITALFLTSILLTL